MSSVYCQSCGSASKYGSTKCSSCGEAFGKFIEIKQSSARIVTPKEITEEDKERAAVLEFDFSCFASELEEHIKRNSEKSLHKTVSMDDILRNK